MSHVSLPLPVAGPRPFRLALPLLLGSLFLVAVVLDVPPEIRGPAPYPVEWQWFRSTGSWPWNRRLVPVALGAAVLLALLAASDSAWTRRNGRTRMASHVLLTTGTLAGWGFSLALLGLEPSGALASVAGRVMSRSYTSYYTVAVSPVAEDPQAFIERHAALLPSFQGWANHAATHPPGPVLYYRGLMALCERAPTLTEALLAAQGHDPLAPVRPPHTRASKAAALLGGLLLMLAGAAAAWPIASLAGRLAGDPLHGVRAGLLWLLLPGPVLFVPQFDQALTLLVAGAAALLAGAAAGRRPWLGAAAAGLLGGVAVYVSYGAAPILVIAGLAALAAAVPDRRSLRRAVTVAAVAGLALITTVLLDHESMAAARTALRIHRDAYTSVRSYALWLGFNLLDLAVFLGVPVAVLGIEQATGALRAVFGGRAEAADRFTAAITLGLGALWLSGTTRGEVGRIWLPLMPLLLVAAWTRRADAPTPSRLQALLLGLLLATTSFVLRVYWIL